MTHIANDYETLLDYLYEEGEPDQRRQIERHLAGCKSCAEVVRDCQSVRGQLSAWTPPAAHLGFKVVQELPPVEKVEKVEKVAKVAPALDPFGKLRVDGEPSRTIDGLEPSRAGRGTQKQGWRPPVARWSAWAQAAAALVLFLSGMAVSQLNVQYANGGLTVSFGRPSALREPQGRPELGRGTTGSESPELVEGRESGVGNWESGRNVTLTPATAAATAASPAATSPEETLRQALASADPSRSGPNAGLRAAQAVPSSSRDAADSDALLRRVQAMIERSEQRQQQELALRLAQVVRDVDAQRRADLLRVEQNFGQLEGQTGAAMARQRDELLNYLVRVSQSQK